MLTRNSYIYSIRAAQSIAGKKVTRVEVWEKVCLVYADGDRPTFISKKKFHEFFVKRRRQDGEELTRKVSRIQDGSYTVDSQTVPDKPHQVTEELDVNTPSPTPYLRCSCWDYALQLGLSISRHPCCKHCYAVLYRNGHDGSYREWQERKHDEILHGRSLKEAIA